MSNARQHAIVVAEILAKCGARNDCRLWSNNTGVGRGLANDGVIRFGLVGSSDIIGIGRGGYLLCMEVKTGKGKPTKQQLQFAKMIRAFGGRYVIVRSAWQASDWLDSLGL